MVDGIRPRQDRQQHRSTRHIRQPALRPDCLVRRISRAPRTPEKRGTANATNAGNAAVANAATINPSGLDINSFLNPYQNDVINSTLGLPNQQNAQALNSTNAGAAGENAFGGDRNAVATPDSINITRSRARTRFPIWNQQGFNTALNSALGIANTNAANTQQAVWRMLLLKTTWRNSTPAISNRRIWRTPRLRTTWPNTMPATGNRPIWRTQPH